MNISAPFIRRPVATTLLMTHHPSRAWSMSLCSSAVTINTNGSIKSGAGARLVATNASARSCTYSCGASSVVGVAMSGMSVVLNRVRQFATPCW